MGSGAVDLERQTRFGPVRVHFVALDPDVELRLGKGVGFAEPLQLPLGLAAQEVGFGLVGSQDAGQAMAALPLACPSFGCLERLEVEDPENLRLVDGLGEPLVVEHVGEIDERAGHRRDRDAVDDGAVRVLDAPRAMHRDPPTSLPRTRHGHLDGLRPDQPVH